MPASDDRMDMHPYATVWRTRDLEGWGAALTTDVILDSPLLQASFRGRDTTLDLFAALFQSLDNFEITEHIAADRSHAFVWAATVGGRSFTGVDHVIHDADGQISRISVFIRPLTGLGTFAAALGPALAKRRSRVRGAISTAITPALRLMFAAIDWVATRLIGLR